MTSRGLRLTRMHLLGSRSKPQGHFTVARALKLKPIGKELEGPPKLESDHELSVLHMVAVLVGLAPLESEVRTRRSGHRRTAELGEGY
jgi:hypothetical protein